MSTPMIDCVTTSGNARRPAISVTAIALCVLGAVPLQGQSAQAPVGPRAAASVGVSYVGATTLTGVTRRRDNGLVASAEGRLRLEILSLIIGYQQGSLGPSADRRGYAEGSIAIAATVNDVLEVRGGANVRVLGEGQSIDRWVQWVAAGRLEQRLEPTALSLLMEARLGLASRAGETGRRATVLGGTTGLRWRRADMDVRIEYSMEETRFPTSGRLTVERLMLAVGVAR